MRPAATQKSVDAAASIARSPTFAAGLHFCRYAHSFAEHTIARRRHTDDAAHHASRVHTDAHSHRLVGQMREPQRFDAALKVDRHLGDR